MPVNYGDPDRSRWYPRRPPPRIPDSFMRWFPVAKPPKRPRTTALDWVSYVVALLALVGLWATNGSVFFNVAFWAVLAFALWRAFLGIVHEQQLTDWVNQPPDSNDVPPEEKPNA